MLVAMRFHPPLLLALNFFSFFFIKRLIRFAFTLKIMVLVSLLVLFLSVVSDVDWSSVSVVGGDGCYEEDSEGSSNVSLCPAK